MSTYRDGVTSAHPYKDPTPLPESTPKVQELGTTSAPLKSAAFFLGAHCKEYNGALRLTIHSALRANGNNCWYVWRIRGFYALQAGKPESCSLFEGGPTCDQMCDRLVRLAIHLTRRNRLMDVFCYNSGSQRCERTACNSSMSTGNAWRIITMFVSPVIIVHSLVNSHTCRSGILFVSKTRTDTKQVHVREVGAFRSHYRHSGGFDRRLMS